MLSCEFTVYRNSVMIVFFGINNFKVKLTLTMKRLEKYALPKLFMGKLKGGDEIGGGNAAAAAYENQQRRVTFASLNQNSGK